MTGTLAARFLLAGLVFLAALLAWESSIAWTLYHPVNGPLGGFVPTPAGVQVRPPGDEASGPLIPTPLFRGAVYDVVEPKLAAALLGTTPRVRLIGVLVAPPGAGPQAAPTRWTWGGGRDPLGRFLWVTRPFSKYLVEVHPAVLAVHQAARLSLRWEDDQLALRPGS